jgi:SAM-dependent methyltransferase
VDGVILALPRPAAVSANLRGDTVAEWARRQVLAASLGRAPDPSQPDREEVARALAAMEANDELLRELLAPLFRLAPPMSELAPPSELADVLACDDGWSFEKTLPYFHADWSAARSESRELLLADAERYVAPGAASGAALVLGSAGGRLVHDLAGTFGGAWGVDRSIGALLLARRLIAGESVTVHVGEAGWRPCALRSVSRRAPGATLVAGDASALPFAGGSFSLVVTQYLLDIVGDPDSVLREINRVLAVGGVWIHLGLPFRFRGQPAWLAPAKDDTWPPLAARFGFEVIFAERRPTSHLALSDLSPWAAGDVHQCVHSVARKSADLPKAPGEAALEAYFLGDAAPLMTLVPSLTESVEVRLRHGRGGKTEPRAIRLGRTSFTPPDEKAFAVALAFLEALDGSTPFGEVVRAVGVAPRDAALALEGLRRAGYVNPR